MVILIDKGLLYHVIRVLAYCRVILPKMLFRNNFLCYTFQIL